MAQLLCIPIRDRGHAVLIISRGGQSILMGFVAQETLAHVVDHEMTSCECVNFVQRHLPLFEGILRRKSESQALADPPLTCVEIEVADLLSGTGRLQ
jgi:hypothetical protein